jgi:exonuclease I
MKIEIDIIQDDQGFLKKINKKFSGSKVAKFILMSTLIAPLAISSFEPLILTDQITESAHITSSVYQIKDVTKNFINSNNEDTNVFSGFYQKDDGSNSKIIIPKLTRDSVVSMDKKESIIIAEISINECDNFHYMAKSNSLLGDT